MIPDEATKAMPEQRKKASVRESEISAKVQELVDAYQGQEQLANALPGATRQMVSSWLNDRKKPDAKSLLALGNAAAKHSNELARWFWGSAGLDFDAIRKFIRLESQSLFVPPKEGRNPDDLHLMIKKLRNDLGLRQSDLARLVGAVQSQIVEWEKVENRRESPTAEKHIKMAFLAKDDDALWFLTQAFGDLSKLQQLLERVERQDSSPLISPFMLDLSGLSKQERNAIELIVVGLLEKKMLLGQRNAMAAAETRKEV